ncbi:hypothetical protein VYU27_008184 [Nannochloropsis oceanica]
MASFSLLWEQLQGLEDASPLPLLLPLDEAQRAADDGGEAAFASLLRQASAQPFVLGTNDMSSNDKSPILKLADALREGIEELEAAVALAASNGGAAANGAAVMNVQDNSKSSTSIEAFLTGRGYPYALDNSVDILTFLAAELQVARVLATRQAPSSSPSSTKTNSEIQFIFRILTKALKSLDISATSSSVPPSASPSSLPSLLTLVESALDARLAALPLNYITQDERLVAPSPSSTSSTPSPSTTTGVSTPSVQLTPKQRAVLTDIDMNLRHDFALRRRMLLKRLDVTLQSFLWAQKAKGVEATIVSAVNGL